MTNMKEVAYNPDSLSHHIDNIIYWVTQGIVIDDVRYSIVELFVRSGSLFAIVTQDKIKYYEYRLTSNVTQSSYDDSKILERISRLENKEIPSYNDSGIISRLDNLEKSRKNELDNIITRLSNLENKPDNDNQLLSIVDNKLSISNGNSVDIPFNVYNDSNIKQRLKSLEDKRNTLTVVGDTLSISDGNTVTLPKHFGDSAYDIWLSLGNSGTKQDFINSLKGSKGDKGDVTDIGINAVRKYVVTLNNPSVPAYNVHDHYKTLTWNSKTEFGNLHLDLLPKTDTEENVIIGKIPDGVPKPHSLIEVSVKGSTANGIGQIYVETSGVIKCNNLLKGIRYTVDLFGYFR